MNDETVRDDPSLLQLIPDYYKTQEMCEKAVRREQYTLKSVSDHFITQKMCNDAMFENPAVFFSCS